MTLGGLLQGNLEIFVVDLTMFLTTNVFVLKHALTRYSINHMIIISAVVLAVTSLVNQVTVSRQLYLH